mmetsp:Transcript_18414/g.32731  ORF Transcript_18414/g.32731 Transcript_18414/m.32731 type:complete len:205 (-) Transcript_18414:181-795(-)
MTGCAEHGVARRGRGCTRPGCHADHWLTFPYFWGGSEMKGALRMPRARLDRHRASGGLEQPARVWGRQELRAAFHILRRLGGGFVDLHVLGQGGRIQRAPRGSGDSGKINLGSLYAQGLLGVAMRDTGQCCHIPVQCMHSPTLGPDWAWLWSFDPSKPTPRGNVCSERARCAQNLRRGPVTLWKRGALFDKVSDYSRGCEARQR